jgi:hypothetical protein
MLIRKLFKEAHRIVFYDSFIIKRNLSNINQLTLQKYLQSKIKTSGPITVAEYMKECLGNPLLVITRTRIIIGFIFSNYIGLLYEKRCVWS